MRYLNRLFFIPELECCGKETTVSFSEKKHIDVLRVKEGDIFLATDGKYNLYKCSVVYSSKKELIVKAIEKEKKNEYPLKINLLFGITKRDKWEWLVEKAVEMGVVSFTPIISERNREYAKGIDKKSERFEKIAISAMKQSKRCFLPKLEKSLQFGDIHNIIKPEDSYLLSFNGTDLKKDEIKMKDEIFLIIGPEGGFSEKEEKILINLGVNQINLGIYTLKTETAALKTVSLLTYFAGNF